MKFNKGDLVAWTSSSNGTTSQKTGVVEFVIRPGIRPSLDFLNVSGKPRDHESYVIRVGKTEKLKGKRYWPVASKLQAI